MPASKPAPSKHASQHRYPPELRERAIRMVLETIKETGERHGVVIAEAIRPDERHGADCVRSEITVQKQPERLSRVLT
jgi:transposase-like protein